MRHWEGQKRLEPLPPPDPGQIVTLRGGAEAWNAWRRQHPDVAPALSGAQLQGADLSDYDLREARLEGADLTRANLERADLAGASLHEAILYEANLDAAHLTGANLEDADLLMTSASKAILSGVKARGARWAGAIVRGSQVGGADLRDADLREAEFQGSDLRRARLEGAILWTTHLDEADLRDASGMRLDETIIRNSKFSPRSSDRWSTLRRHYTGPRYAVTLLLLVAFVLPYFAKAAGWVAAARTQEVLDVALTELDDRLAPLGDSAVAAEIVGSIREGLPIEGAPGWRKVRVWQLLLGVDKGLGYLLTTCLLLLYNILRGLLTWVVGPMRDAEERSGVAPPHRIEGLTRAAKLVRWLRGGWAESYAWLWLPHRVVSVLFVVAVGSFALHAANWLSLAIWLRS